ncbi:hypothetical protein ACFL21_00245 [Patescibacteria group bacterium]
MNQVKSKEGEKRTSQVSELSEVDAETIRTVMDRVIDINKRYNPFSVVRADKISEIFEHGLLGTSKDQPGIKRENFYNETSKEAYLELIRRGICAEVFFSIVGRNVRDEAWEHQRIDQYNYYFKPGRDQIAIMFNLSPYEETVIPGKDPLKCGEFSAYDGMEGDPRYLACDNRGRPKPYIEYGFRLSNEVPRSFFTGVLFNMRRELSEVEYEQRITELLIKNRSSRCSLPYERDESYLRKDESLSFVEETDHEKLTQRANEIAQEMMKANQGMPSLMVPIYDIHGNLWWPRQICYKQL